MIASSFALPALPFRYCVLIHSKIYQYSDEADYHEKGLHTNSVKSFSLRGYEVRDAIVGLLDESWFNLSHTHTHTHTHSFIH